MYAIVMAPKQLGPINIYLDIFLNGLLISLMFKHNDSSYKILCNCCVKICFIHCDSTVNETNEQERRQTVHSYLQTRASKSNAEISRTVTATTTMA